MPDIAIRRATPRDQRAVNDICRRIWRGGDYLPDVFADWVRDRRGGLWVATIGDRVVGVAKLTLLGEDEAWLHALRVDPKFRRRGIAAMLVAHRLERAERLGAGVARLDTSDDNVAVHRLMRRFGFRRLGRYSFWRKIARVGSAPRRAALAELAALQQLAATGDGIVHQRFVKRALLRDDLARAIRRGDCLVVGAVGRPTAMAVVDRTSSPAGTHRGPAMHRLRVAHLAGARAGLRELLAALPAEARRRGLPLTGVTAGARHWAALRSARYRRPWSGAMLIFEKRLD